MKAAKVIREQLRREMLESCSHQFLPAMCLQREFVVRVQSWLGIGWGGGVLMSVVSIEFDPPHSRVDSRLGLQRGFVSLALREFYKGVEPYERIVAAHDLIELVRPLVATPTQWRMRGGL